MAPIHSIKKPLFVSLISFLPVSYLSHKQLQPRMFSIDNTSTIEDRITHLHSNVSNKYNVQGHNAWELFLRNLSNANLYKTTA